MRVFFIVIGKNRFSNEKNGGFIGVRSLPAYAANSGMLSTTDASARALLGRNIKNTVAMQTEAAAAPIVLYLTARLRLAIRDATSEISASSR